MITLIAVLGLLVTFSTTTLAETDNTDEDEKVENGSDEKESDNGLNNQFPEPEDPCGCGSSDIYVKGFANFNGSPSIVEDYYMSVDNAEDFAAEVNPSMEDAVFGVLTSFIPGVGKHIATFGAHSSAAAADLASDIREYTDDDIPVRIEHRDHGAWGEEWVVHPWAGEFSYDNGRFEYELLEVEMQ
ncbi:hypothetical protein [Tenuibacillus multivorans]|uniref:Uncharacterized protein n=1 Tax=Tenuibacillus multivorans TaxID=237069 RepID=A0A1G9X566_9BACI|nr:hypothetical protein [Tenuibacillus multivorans]GEL77234.1 hypothetical protein TMU01_14690 [Tenuibacillus multivorans]SDM91515.1 hypothetical protein SAMN05216498_1006 [Tenuibacillus multivorans]